MAQKKKGLQSAFSFDEFGPYLDNTCQLELCQEGWIFEIVLDKYWEEKTFYDVVWIIEEVGLAGWSGQ